jgi:hypothetical protein
MINLEQVKLLEKKVAKAVDYVERVTKDNAALLQKEAELQGRLEFYQKRIDELEVLIMRFKEDQGQIEDGILAALDKLNRFEEAMEKTLKGKGKGTAKDTAKTHNAASKPAPERDVPPAAAQNPGGEICFEIPENAAGDDTGDDIDPLGGNSLGDDSLGDDDSIGDDGSLEMDDPFEDLDEDPLTDGGQPEGDRELEIF